MHNINKPFKTEPLIHKTDDQQDNQLKNDRLRDEVHALAEAAFHNHLISGHGDSEYPDAYQIVHQGKPLHLPLSRARLFLTQLMHSS